MRHGRDPCRWSGYCGRPTVEATIVHTPRRTVAHIMGVMVIIIQRLTMTLPREPMAGNRRFTALTDRQPAAPATILIPDLRRGASVSTPGSRSAAQAHNYTGTYAQTRQGSSPNARGSPASREGTSATMGQPSTANGTVAGAADSQGGKVAASSTKWGTVRLVRQPAAICMPDTMATFTRIRAMVGRVYDNGSWNSEE